MDIYTCIYTYKCIHVCFSIHIEVSCVGLFCICIFTFIFIFFSIHIEVSCVGLFWSVWGPFWKMCVNLSPANAFAINSRRKSAATHCNTLHHTTAHYSTSCRLRLRNHPGLSNNYTVSMQKSPLFPQKSAIYPERSPTSARKRAL